MMSRLSPLYKQAFSMKSGMFQHTQFSPKILNPQPPSYSYAKICSGTIQKPIEKLMPSVTHDNPQNVESDISGFHKVIITKSCKEPQCHNRHCDTTHATVCPHKMETAELAGALTHKIPSDKTGVLLNTYDANGKAKPQFMVKEKTTVPVDIKEFKEHEKTTEYVQQEPIAKIIRTNMADNSIISLKNTSVNDTPSDENL